MAPLPVDTDPEALAALFSLYRRMTPAEKGERVRQLTRMANGLALARLREQHPEEDEGELLLRLARRRLGDEIVDRVYGEAPRRDDA